MFQFWLQNEFLVLMMGTALTNTNKSSAYFQTTIISSFSLMWNYRLLFMSSVNKTFIQHTIARANLEWDNWRKKRNIAVVMKDDTFYFNFHELVVWAICGSIFDMWASDNDELLLFFYFILLFFFLQKSDSIISRIHGQFPKNYSLLAISFMIKQNRTHNLIFAHFSLMMIP